MSSRAFVGRSRNHLHFAVVGRNDGVHQPIPDADVRQRLKRVPSSANSGNSTRRPAINSPAAAARFDRIGVPCQASDHASFFRRGKLTRAGEINPRGAALSGVLSDVADCVAKCRRFRLETQMQLETILSFSPAFTEMSNRAAQNLVPFLGPDELWRMRHSCERTRLSSSARAVMLSTSWQTQKEASIRPIGSQLRMISQMLNSWRS
jgi:hypothetical protein